MAERTATVRHAALRKVPAGAAVAARCASREKRRWSSWPACPALLAFMQIRSRPPAKERAPANAAGDSRLRRHRRRGRAPLRPHHGAGAAARTPHPTPRLAPTPFVSWRPGAPLRRTRCSSARMFSQRNGLWRRSWRPVPQRGLKSAGSLVSCRARLSASCRGSEG